MDTDELISAEDLWWNWAVVAATKGLPKGATASLRQDEHVLTLERGNSWLRMQRFRRGRAVLWGRTDETETDAVDVLDTAPDWASSNAVWRSVRTEHPEFLAWYAHGEWDSNTPEAWTDSEHLFEVLRDPDPDVLRSARAGESDDPLLVAARTEVDLTVQGSLRKRIREQIHRQMRDGRELARSLPSRPAALARWAKVNQPSGPFVHTVLVDEGEIVHIGSERPLTDAMEESLGNVLTHLHQEEAGDESGAWLLARVEYADGKITLDRAFDTIPEWFRARGPTMETLNWEMNQRSEKWRPAWTALLPRL